MLTFDKETYLSLFFRFILSGRLSISLCRSEVSLFFWIHKYGIHFVLYLY